MRPQDRARARLLRAGAIGGVLVLLSAALWSYVKGDNPSTVESIVVVAAVVLVAVLVGAAVALESSHPPPPPPPPIGSPDEK